MSHQLQVAQFEARLRSAVDRARAVLEAAKAPCLAGNVQQRFEDKYLLAEHVTDAAAASQLNSLAALGVTPECLARLRRWARAGAISLRFRAEERCRFLREATRDVESPARPEHYLSCGGLLLSALASKVATEVTEYFWQLEVSYELLAVRGAGEQPSDRLTLLARTGSGELRTAAKRPPRPGAKIPALEQEVPVCWLLQQLSAEDEAPRFKVDRGSAACRTPRRNPEVDAAARHFRRFAAWAARVANYVEGLFCAETEGEKRAYEGDASRDAPFVPVLPLMQGETEEGAAGVLGPAGANRLLAEEARSLEERRRELSEAFPEGGGVATAAEALLVLDLRHCVRVCAEWLRAVDYIEGLLRKQLIAAIGREVTPADIAEHTRLWGRRLFAEAFAPSPFCFAVRRSSSHAPEGTVSIEQAAVGGRGANGTPSPIFTLRATSARPRAMELPLSASTKVRFGGERYLHAWLSHAFSGAAAEKPALVSRARQFGSMLVLVGRIASATSFEPMHAAIVRDKDELSIPLDLSMIPAPKDFRDAIGSLSPEQQAFAKAFRSMQLGSTLFGVLVIQIKPQLESVLNLHPGSLTKEVRLTQDLLDLFIKYHIPSDLLSFEMDPSAVEVAAGGPAARDRLEAVRGRARAMSEMISAAKGEGLAERRAEARWAAARGARGGGRGPSLPLGHRRSFGAKGFDAKAFMPQRGNRRSFDAKGFDAKAFMPQRVNGELAGPSALSWGVSQHSRPTLLDAVSEVGAAAFRVATGLPSARAPLTSAGPAGPSEWQAGQQLREAQGPQRGSRPRPMSWAGTGDGESEVDFTLVPQEMDWSFEHLDIDGALRPTIITVGGAWRRRAQRALLARPEEQDLGAAEQKMEKDAAFDLLDALTKSGAVSLEHASLHVVVAATHCFDKSVMDTVVQDNISPMDKLERSMLIMASTVHGRPAAVLAQESQRARLRASSPMLFLDDA